MMSLTLGCKSSPDLHQDKDVCKGIILIYLNKDINYSKEEKRFILSNNEFACEKCKSHLTFQEQEICDAE